MRKEDGIFDMIFLAVLLLFDYWLLCMAIDAKIVIVRRVHAAKQGIELNAA
jgi:hypothetical protein